MNSLLLHSLHAFCGVQQRRRLSENMTNNILQFNCREPPIAITTISKKAPDYLSSAIMLKAGSTERIPNTSNMSFSLKPSQSSYTCQLQKTLDLYGCLCRWRTIQWSEPLYYCKQITMLTCCCSRQLDYSLKGAHLKMTTYGKKKEFN